MFTDRINPGENTQTDKQNKRIRKLTEDSIEVNDVLENKTAKTKISKSPQYKDVRLNSTGNRFGFGPDMNISPNVE